MLSSYYFRLGNAAEYAKMATMAYEFYPDKHPDHDNEPGLDDEALDPYLYADEIDHAAITDDQEPDALEDGEAIWTPKIVVLPQGGDFMSNYDRARYSSKINTFLKEIEDAALSSPHDSSETTLLRSLDPAHASYQVELDRTIDDRFLIAQWRSRINGPNPEGLDTDETLPMYTTEVQAIASLKGMDEETYNEAANAAWRTSRYGRPFASPDRSKQPSILGVSGEKVNRFPARYTYEGIPGVDENLRRALGALLLEAPQIELVAKSDVTTPFPSDPIHKSVFSLRTISLNQMYPSPITPEAEVAPRLRVLGEFLRRGQTLPLKPPRR